MNNAEIIAFATKEGVEVVTVEKFNEIVENAKKLNELTNDQKLQMYGLFKQATVGKVNTSRPWAIDMVGAAKWDAWKAFESLTAEQARTAYYTVVAKFFEDQGLAL